MERNRSERFRSQPMPLTWEVPLLIGVVTLLVAVMTPLAIQAMTCAVLAGDPAWPSEELGAALGGLAHGKFGVGLPAPAAAALPPAPVMWAITFVGEVAVLGSLLILACRLRGLLGIGSRRGLATRAQATHALGLKPLRKKAAVVHPDLHGRIR